VQVTGDVDYARVPGFLARMDVAVAPYPRLSNFYFSPLKVYEYMAAGVPIVASAIGQVTEVLSHRKTALLHPPGSVGKMVAHLEELRDRPRLRARLARAARRLAVTRFTWARNAARVLSMLETLRRQVREGRCARTARATCSPAQARASPTRCAGGSSRISSASPSPSTPRTGLATSCSAPPGTRTCCARCWWRARSSS